MADPTSLFYNYDTMKITGLTSGSVKHLIALPQSTSTNLKYKNVQYSAIHLFFYKTSSPAEPKYYMIIQNLVSGSDAKHNAILFAIELISGASTATEVDKILNGTETSVEITLNNQVTDGGDIDIVSTSNSIYVITLRTKMSVLQSSYSDLNTKGFLTKDSTEIKNFLTNFDEYLPKGGTDASPGKVRKTILDWQIDCTLLGEDSEYAETVVANSDNTSIMDNLQLAFVLILIVSGIYLATPAIFQRLVLPIAISHSAVALPLKSIDIYWTVVGFFAILVLFIYGIAAKQNMMYFILICIFLLFLAAKSVITNNLGNFYGTEIDQSTLSSDFKRMFDTEIQATPSLNPDMFAAFIGGTKLGGFLSFTIICLFISISLMSGALGAIKFASDANNPQRSEFERSVSKSKGDAIFYSCFFIGLFMAFVGMLFMHTDVFGVIGSILYGNK